MSALVNVSLGILFLATALTITSPLIDKILTDNVINIMEWIIDNIEFFVWSSNTNIFVIMILTIILLTIYRFAFSFFNQNSNR